MGRVWDAAVPRGMRAGVVRSNLKAGYSPSLVVVLVPPPRNRAGEIEGLADIHRLRHHQNAMIHDKHQWLVRERIPGAVQ